MGWHSIYDGLDDIAAEGNIVVLDEQLKNFKIKQCPLCGKAPMALSYDNKEHKIVFRLLCVQHQDECKPKLRTAPYDWLDDAVQHWNSRVRQVTTNYNIKQIFQEIQHEEFVSFLGGDSNG